MEHHLDTIAREQALRRAIPLFDGAPAVARL